MIDRTRNDSFLTYKDYIQEKPHAEQQTGGLFVLNTEDFRKLKKRLKSGISAI